MSTLAGKQLIMYSRTHPCGYTKLAKRVLEKYKLDYLEIFIDQDEEACQRVIEWTGFESVPTIILANEGSVVPAEEPTYLEKGASPRGIDRGYMITEPGREEFLHWLQIRELIQEIETEV